MTNSEPRVGSPGADELLGRLYRQLTELQAAQFAAGYDIAAGLYRYAAWLRGHAAEAPGTDETLIAGRAAQEPAAMSSQAPEVRPDQDVDRAVTDLYRMPTRFWSGWYRCW